MVKKLAVPMLVIVALLVPTLVGNAMEARDVAGQPNMSMSTTLTSPSALLSSTVGSSFDLQAFSSVAAPAPRCRLGAWASSDSVATVRRGGYVHVNTVADAQRYFPALSGKGVIRGLRCPSLACMEDLANQLRARGIPFDAFCYDLEGWDQTPQWEREHQVEATAQARALADRYGVKLVMGPARAFTWRNWSRMAPYAHMWVIQAQAGQRSYPVGTQFFNWLKTYVDLLSTNPTMPIWAQLSTLPEQPLTLQQYMAYVDLVKPSLIDGLYVFNPRDTLPLANIWNAECGTAQ